jgi:hypothetical protein
LKTKCCNRLFDQWHRGDELSGSERIMLKTHARIHHFFSCPGKRQENTGGQEKLEGHQEKNETVPI